MTAIDFAIRLRAKLRIAIAFILGLAAVSIVWAGPSVFPTGVTRYDPSKAYNCDVLFSPMGNKTYLIDMDGNVVHQWDHAGFPTKILWGWYGQKSSRKPGSSFIRYKMLDLFQAVPAFFGQ